MNSYLKRNNSSLFEQRYYKQIQDGGGEQKIDC